MPPKRKVLPHASQYTVGWIAALPHERAAAATVLDERHDKPQDFKKNPSDQNSYDWGQIGEHNIVIASLPTGEYGTVSAADTASSLRASLPQIRIGLLVGIGAGLPGEQIAPDGTFILRREILLGDVVVSNPDGTNGGVVQYDLYKAKVEGGTPVRERKGFLNSPPRALRSALGALRAEHEMEESCISEFLEAFERNPKMKIPYGFPGIEKDHLRTSQSRETPEIHYGTIASGNILIKDTQERDSIIQWLGKENVNPLCYEMEAAGLMNSFPCVVIRGICDYANEHKNDEWQRYAAATAAAFAKELLQYVDAVEVDMTPKIAEVLENINVKVNHVQQDVQKLVIADEDRPGTNLWFLESDTFKAWIGGRTPYLFIHGGVGCGKSTLNKAIADAEYLQGLRVVSFYFSSTTGDNHGLNALLRYLVAQLCGTDGIPEELQNVYERHNRVFPPERPDDDVELQSLIETLLGNQSPPGDQDTPFYLLIDGLDEINPKSRRRSVLDYLNVLSARRPSNLRVLATSRPAEIVASLLPGWLQVPIPANRVRDDIELYVRKRMNDQHELVILDERLKQQIVDKLAGPEQSMFRYAYMQLERILNSHMLLATDVQQTLTNLPPTLNDTYSAILHDIDPLHRDLALIALRWLIYCQKPLLIDELLDACMISTSGPGFQEDKRLTIQQMLSLLPNLISIELLDPSSATEEAKGFVVFAHFSVKEYLLDHMPSALDRHFDLKAFESHRAIASACIIFLSETNIPHKRADSDFLTNYAWYYWPLHAAQGKSDAVNVTACASRILDGALAASGKHSLAFSASLGGHTFAKKVELATEFWSLFDSLPIHQPLDAATVIESLTTLPPSLVTYLRGEYLFPSAGKELNRTRSSAVPMKERY